MAILNTVQTADNSMTSLYTVPAGKKALVNVTALGESGAHSQIGIVPAGGTTVKQVSALGKPFTVLGDYPIGFVDDRKIYPKAIVDETADNTVTRLAQQRFYLSSTGISDQPDILHLLTENNRIVRAGNWGLATETGNISSPSSYIDDPTGEVFSEPEKVVVIREGTDRWLAVKTNGDVYGCADSNSIHAWTKFTYEPAGVRKAMQDDPDNFIPLGGTYDAGPQYFSAVFYDKKRQAAVYVGLYRPYISTPTSSIIFGDLIPKGEVMPQAFRTSGGINASNRLAIVRRASSTQSPFHYMSSYNGYTNAYPYWKNSGHTHPLSSDDNVKVVAIGRNDNFSTNGYNYFLQTSLGDTYAADGAGSANYYTGYQREPELSTADIESAESFYAGKPVGVANRGKYTTNYIKKQEFKLTGKLQAVAAFENGVPQADVTLAGDGFGAYRGILLGAGDELKVFSERATIYTVTGVEEAV